MPRRYDERVSTTKKRALLAVALLLIVGLIALVLLFWSDAPGKGSEVRDGARVVVASPERTMDEGADAAGASRTRTTTGSESRTLPATLPAFADASGIRIVVLAAGTRLPVAGAQVHVRPDPAASFSVFNLDPDETWVGPDYEAFVRAGGLALQSDANGEVDLPSPTHRSHVTARFEDQLGWTQIEALETGLVEVAMMRTHAVVVLVRDAIGAPAPDVGVAFGHCDGEAAYWRMPTDARGEVHIPSIEILTEEAGIGPLTAFSLRLDIPDLPRVEHWSTVGDLTGAPIELTLPASGSARVVLVDEQGRTAPLSGTARLEPKWADFHGSARIDEPGVTRVELANGVAQFPRLGLGRRFDLELEVPGSADMDHDFLGPKVAGECVTIEVPLEVDNALVRGRLVDEAGLPLSDLRFAWMTILRDDRTLQRSERNVFQTDGSGRFTRPLLRVQPEHGPFSQRLDFLQACGPATERRQAHVRLPLEITDLHVDLGDIVMIRAGPILAGGVRDSLDRPAALVQVAVGVRVDGGLHEFRAYEAVTTGSDGAFALFGPCTNLPIGLALNFGPLRGTLRVPVTCPDDDIVIRLDATGGIEGTAVIDRDADLDALAITFAYDGPSSANGAHASWRRVGERLFFQFYNEAPGSGSARFAFGPTSTSAPVEVQGLSIPEGRVDRPRALVDVDLRGKLPGRTSADPTEAVLFTVVDPAGRPIPRGTISGRYTGGLEFQRTFGGGRALVPREEVSKCSSIEIWAPQCRALVLQDPFTLRRVTLQPDLAVEFHLDWPAKWREAGLELVGDVTFVDTDPPQFQPAAFARMQPFRFDAAGRGRVHLMASGRFSIYATVVRQGVRGLEDIDYGIGLLQHEFTVHETDAVQRFELTLDPENVAQMNEDLSLK